MKKILSSLLLVFIISAANAQTKDSTVTKAPEEVSLNDLVFSRVEVDAEFPGGEKAFGKYKKKQFNTELAKNVGAPARTYKIAVQFIVDSEGTLHGIKPLTKNGYGLEEEAVRMLKEGPKWTPPMQNGRKVKAYRLVKMEVVID